MRYCGHCGKEIHEEAVRCVHCGKDFEEKTASASVPASRYEYADGFACILCILCPIFGFILFATNEQNRLAIAKSYLSCALIGLIIGSIIAAICFFNLLAAMGVF